MTRSRAKQLASSTECAGAHAIAFDADQEGREPYTLKGLILDPGGVVELARDEEAGTPSEGLNRLTLAIVAVL